MDTEHPVISRLNGSQTRANRPSLISNSRQGLGSRETASVAEPFIPALLKRRAWMHESQVSFRRKFLRNSVHLRGVLGRTTGRRGNRRGGLYLF